MDSLVNFFHHIPIIDSIIQHFWTILASIFTILLALVGMANRKLPPRDDIAIEHYHDQNIGDNSKLWQLFSKFRQNNRPNNLEDAHLNTEKLSGIHAIPEGEKAFNARILLTQLAEKTLDLQYYM